MAGSLAQGGLTLSTTRGRAGKGGQRHMDPSGRLWLKLQKEAWEETYVEIKPSGVIRLNHCELINVYGWLIERSAAVTSRSLWSSHRMSYLAGFYNIAPKPTGWILSVVGFALWLNHPTLSNASLAWDLRCVMKADRTKKAALVMMTLKRKSCPVS